MAEITVGGQAVIEGVMMRSPERYSTAVRLTDGSIKVKTEQYFSLSKRFKILAAPFLRGIVTFFEMMVIGIKTLNFSADVSITDAEHHERLAKGESIEVSEQKKKSGSTSLVLGLTVVLSLGLGVFIFFWTPIALATWLNLSRDAFAFNLLAGGIRVCFLIGYMSALLLSKEFKRIFEYHGAEHKAIAAFENKADLTPESAARFTRFHPRCGTSFLLIVALSGILFFAIIDSIYAGIVGHLPNLLERTILHLSLLPAVPAFSYEILRFSARTQTNPITKILIQPGLWLQRITTREPDHSQLEVAIVALEEALAHSETALNVTRVTVS